MHRGIAMLAVALIIAMRGIAAQAQTTGPTGIMPGQGLGDQEVGGVDGAALGDVDVPGVGELGVLGQVGPGHPE